MHKTPALPSHCVNKFEVDIFMCSDRDRITSDSITLKSTRTKIQQSALFNNLFFLILTAGNTKSVLFAKALIILKKCVHLP